MARVQRRIEREGERGRETQPAWHFKHASPLSKQSRFREGMQKKRGSGSGKTEDQLEEVRPPYSLFPKQDWLGSCTVGTVSKDLRNKKQTKPSISILRSLISLFLQQQPSPKLFFSSGKQISVFAPVKSKLINPSQFIHKTTRRRCTFLHLSASAYSLYTQHKLTFGKGISIKIQKSPTGINTNIQKSKKRKTR